MLKCKKIIAATVASSTILSGIPKLSYAINDNLVQNDSSIELSNIQISESLNINGYEMQDFSNLSQEELKDEINKLQTLLEFYEKHSGDIKYEVNKNLSKDDMLHRNNEIENKYEVGDVLTPEDEEFVTRFDKNGQVNINQIVSQTQDQLFNLKTRGSHTFSSTVGTKSFSNSKLSAGLTMNFSGSVTWHNGKNNSGGDPSQHRISINSNNSCFSNHVNKRTPQISIKAYGLLSGGTLTLVHNEVLKGVTKSGTGSQTFSDSTSNYTVLIHVKTTVTPRVNFSTVNGSSAYIDGFPD